MNNNNNESTLNTSDDYIINKGSKSRNKLLAFSASVSIIYLIVTIFKMVTLKNEAATNVELLMIQAAINSLIPFLTVYLIATIVNLIAYKTFNRKICYATFILYVSIIVLFPGMYQTVLVQIVLSLISCIRIRRAYLADK